MSREASKALYPDELALIAEIVKTLNSHNCLMLDGDLKYQNENADCIAKFWFDWDAETWRVEIGLFND